MSASHKKVLIITYYFPPSGGAGVQRPLKFVKYLRDFGWEPVVLTAKNADYPAYDHSLESEVPEGVKVYRSKIIEPYRLYRMFTGKQQDVSTDIATLTLDDDHKRKWSERISEGVRSTFFIPDARIGWLFFAYRLGLKIITRENISAIFSTAPPYTTNLIGLKLKRATGLPWLADFRDSWIGWLSTPQWRPKLSRRLEMRMEEAVLRESDRLLTVSHGVKEDLFSRHPHVCSQHWHFLSNGFDRTDFEGIQPQRVSDKITLTYVGSMYGARNPEFLLQALESLQQSNPKAIEKLHVLFVGRIGESIRRRIETSPLSEMFEMIPYVPHSESLAYLLGSDILLLIIDDAPANRGILTGKLFEYIGAGKPILALAPEGEAAELIRSHELGEVASPRNVPEIRRSLLRLIDSIELHPKKKVPDAVVRDKFERKELTRKLAAHLDELTEAKRDLIES